MCKSSCIEGTKWNFQHEEVKHNQENKEIGDLRPATGEAYTIYTKQQECANIARR